MKELLKKLEERREKASTVMGDVGKTQNAMHYAEENHCKDRIDLKNAEEATLTGAKW